MNRVNRVSHVNLVNLVNHVSHANLSNINALYPNVYYKKTKYSYISLFYISNFFILVIFATLLLLLLIVANVTNIFNFRFFFKIISHFFIGMTLPLALFASSYNEDDANESIIHNSKSSYTPVKNNKNNYILGNNDNNNNYRDNIGNTYSKNKNANHRKTIKQKPTAPNESKLIGLLKSMNQFSDSDNDDDNNGNHLANFKSIGDNSISHGSSESSGSSMFPPLPELNYKGPATPDSSSEKNQQETPYTLDIPTSSTGTVSNNMYKEMPSTYANQYYKQFVPYLNQGSSEMPEQPKSELIEKLNYIIDLLEEQQDYKTNSIFEDLILYAFLGIFVIFIVDSFSRSSKYVR